MLFRSDHPQVPPGVKRRGEGRGVPADAASARIRRVPAFLIEAGIYFLLLFTLGLFLVSALATGLFISTVAESQALAFMISLLVTLLPTFILSGFIFPIASMPWPIRIVTFAVPARYFLVALALGISVWLMGMLRQGLLASKRQVTACS